MSIKHVLKMQNLCVLVLHRLLGSARKQP